MFGIFPILFIYTNNLSEISLDSLLIPVLGIFGLISVLLLILVKVSKNIQKSTLFLSLSLFLFFSIGYTKLLFHGLQIFNSHSTLFVFFIYSLIFLTNF